MTTKHLYDVLDRDNLDHHVLSGNVSRTPHPEFDLFIFNYTSQAQFSRLWDEETMNCRGLIVDHNDMIVARGWAKFFNHTETAVPKFALTMPPVVTEKMDGSLGVIYPTPEGRFAVSTRGSFASDQAIWASGWLASMFPLFRQPEGVTTLVEIIYPQNRIVVNYGDRAELVLLGAVENHTGADIPLWEIDWWPGARTEMHVGLGHMDDVNRHVVRSYGAGDEAEGIVATWYRPGEPSFRLKVKSLDYTRLHRIITGFNTKTIWQTMARGGDFTEILDRVPDEFYGWVRGITSDLRRQFLEIEEAAREDFLDVVAQVGTEDRKAFAAKAKKKTNPGILFSMLDGKDYDDAIWKMIKPKAERPFVDQGEEG